MARSITSISVSAVLQATLMNAINGVAAASTQHKRSFAPATTLASGTGANQFDRVWSSEGRALNASATETIDLYDLGTIDIGGGAGKDAAGQAVTIAEIVGLMIWNKPTSIGSLLIGGEGSAAAFQSLFHVSGTASDTAGFGPLGPGGVFFVFDPNDPAWAVADTSNHLLKLAANAAGNLTYDIMFLGRSG